MKRKYEGKTHKLEATLAADNTSIKELAQAQRAAGMTIREIARWFDATYQYDATERLWQMKFTQWAAETEQAQEVKQNEYF